MKHTIAMAILIITIGTSSLFAGRICNDFCDTRVRIVDRFDVVQKTVQFDADYFLGINGYYDVVEDLRTAKYVETQSVLEKQQSQINQLIALLTQKAIAETPQVTPVTPVIPEVPTVPTVPDVPTTDTNVPQEATALDVKTFRIFINKCAKCHSDDKAKAGLSLVSIDTSGEYLNNIPLAMRVIIHDHASGIGLEARGKKLMPLGGPPLSDEDVELLRLWTVEKAEKIKKEES